jgi:hypothetical protein
MAADEKADWSLIAFARQVAGVPQGWSLADSKITEPAPEQAEFASETTATKQDHKILEDPPPMDGEQQAAPADLPETQPVIPPKALAGKQLRTPDEIAAMILDTLRTIDSRAGRGFVVTVYGSNPWNAMLTIRPEAGPGIDRALWTSRANEISVALRDHFDVTQ